MPIADPSARAKWNKSWRKRNTKHLLEYKRARYDPIAHAATRRRKIEKDPLYDKRIKYKWRYNLSLEAFDQILADQGNRCKCCGKEDPGGRGWTVHHSHKSGKVLAILCNLCNGGSGMLGDDPARLRRMAEINEET